VHRHEVAVYAEQQRQAYEHEQRQKEPEQTRPFRGPTLD
jgi:hypothetical protein